jgi:phosphotransferase system enzyme I (PtsP)
MQPASLLEDIFRIISDSHRPEATLNAIVKLVAERLNVDVCSVYLFDENREYLVLRATVGLRSDSVGKIKMRIDQGLTGWALEKMAPVFAIQPSSHPRYKYFANSGEEAYQTFLGLPLIYHQQTLGVLVAQTLKPDAIQKSDLNIFSAVASQIAATVAYSGLLEDLARERGEHPDFKRRVTVTNATTRPKGRPGRHVLRGTPVSTGVGIGEAHYLARSFGFDQIEFQQPENIETEEKRLDAAIRKTQSEIQTLIGSIEGLSASDIAVLEVHSMLVQDTQFRERLSECIVQSVCAEFALKQVVGETIEQFMQLEDPYLRERASDIEDVGKRILGNLLKLEMGATAPFVQPTIVIASDISPVDLIRLRQENLAGIVLTRGGKTSHAVLLAKSFQIPTIIGVKHLVTSVREKDRLIVDGASGLVFRNPPQAILDEYKRLKEEKKTRDQTLDFLRDRVACTRDSYNIGLGANISLLSDLEMVDRCGADHIGLYRTEFPFLVRRSFPTEEEQFDLYSKILNGSGNRMVTIRTLDVGGDKFLSYLDYPREENPYLGWRSVRVSLELDDVFRTQLRAILRASVHGAVRIVKFLVCSKKKNRRLNAATWISMRTFRSASWWRCRVRLKFWNQSSNRLIL